VAQCAGPMYVVDGWMSVLSQQLKKKKLKKMLSESCRR
jgi:hypothetical protein